MVTELRDAKPPVFPSRRITLATMNKEDGVDVLKAKIMENLSDTLTILKWCKTNNITAYRMSSELFPHMSNPRAPNYTFDFAKEKLMEIGDYARDNGIRLTFHPGQYNVVGTPSEAAFKQTCIDLKYHADVLDLMEMGKNSVMVVHGGGVYGNKEETINRWCEQFKQLPENVQERLVLENCEKCFSVEDCLKVSERVGIPVVFDTHHHDCYIKLHSDEKLQYAGDYIGDILQTWFKRGIRPKFHVSEQGAGRLGHHSDYIETMPEYLLNIRQEYGVEVDVMIEAKMKEKAIMRLREKYNTKKDKKRPKRLVIVNAI
jgi:UV DNA damage endonuclease